MTSILQQITLGFVLASGGWLIARLSAGAGIRASLALLVDGVIPLAAFGIMFAASARPISAGVLTVALTCTYALADRAKRKVLLEPIVYTDFYQTIDVVVRHPEVNLLFNDSRCIVLASIAVSGIVLSVFHWEPALWAWSPWPGVLSVGVAGCAGWAIGTRMLQPCARRLREMRPSGDPMRDAAALGPFLLQLAYGVIARAERQQRQAAVAPAFPARAVGSRTPRRASPVVVMQCESFFDPRRLDVSLGQDLLPCFDECRATGVQWGRLAVPGSGANTVRTEFSVLTGLGETALGFDRFNPYLNFARIPVRSLAWQMRAEGYRTVCIHPFDRRFYGRDRVMANLGFDLFLGEEAFVGAERNGPYVTDLAVARLISDVVLSERRVFVFSMTMENHGPWPTTHAGGPADLPGALADIPDAGAVAGYLRRLKATDAALGMLTRLLYEHGDDDALFAFYGDHLPSFPAVFRNLGFQDKRTDYAIWRPRRGAAPRLDLAAQELSQAISAACQSSQSLHIAQGRKIA